MQRCYSWSWVEAQVAQTIAVWDASAAPSTISGPRYRLKQQQTREKALDQALRAVEREVKNAPRTRIERLETQDRIIASFARFSAVALDLEPEAVKFLTDDFLPAGMKLAQWARQFDANLSAVDMIQAVRNTWTACGLQMLLGDQVGITSSILGYSLLYPYTDNYLDREDLSVEAKLRFSERFRGRRRRDNLTARNDREALIWPLIGLIEAQYPRTRYPQVFDCLLAIHRAQEKSIAQLKGFGNLDDAEVLQVSCAKGGTSVLADACLAHGWLNEEENRFSFEWGVLLQLCDDLQDVHDDLQHRSVTLFSRAAALGRPLDGLVMQLLNFSERVGARMDNLPDATEMLKELLRMSWRSLILGAIADAQEFFTPAFLEEVERLSPFRFPFLRARHKKITRQSSLNAILFDAFLEAREVNQGALPSPDCRKSFGVEADAELIADMRATG